MTTENALLLLAFGTFSTAFVLTYLVALWTRPRLAWAAVVVGALATGGMVLLSEMQAQSAQGETPGAATLIMAGVLGIATIGALVGAGYGTWKARG
ncbi:MAG: hypothetical protein MUD11_09435 [Rhodobacteraceae bacterium]|jgi:hypothetical protein|nr:hypothetical protein [Paracoccaceae bacterium]